jgi:hypothetical protein
MGTNVGHDMNNITLSMVYCGIPDSLNPRIPARSSPRRQSGALIISVRIIQAEFRVFS